MAKPISNATRRNIVLTSPMSVQTLADELTSKVRHDFETRVIPWTKARRGAPPCLAYAVTVGTGKTGAIVRLVESALAKKFRVAIRTPTLELGRELVERLERTVPGAAGLWRGREQSDPASPDHAMCRRAEDVKASQAVGGSPSDVCGAKKRGYCPFHPDGGYKEPCGYLSQNLGHRQVVVFAGDEMLERAPRRGMKRASDWRPYRTTQFHQRGLFGSVTGEGARTYDTAEVNDYNKSCVEKRDFDLLILDETDPVSFVAGFNLPPISLSLDASIPIIAAVNDPIDQEILTGFLSSLQDACREVGAGGYLTALEPGKYYHDLSPDQILGLNWGDDNGQICRSELTTNDFIDCIETVRDVALANLPEPVEKNTFFKLTAAQIKEKNAETVIVLSLLLAIARVGEVMSLGLRNDLPILRHLKVAADPRALYLRRKTSLSRHYSEIPTMIFDATLRAELLQYTFPNLEVAFKRNVKDGDGVQRFQLRDRDLSYGTLKSAEWPARIGLFACMCARMHGRTGLIGPKFIREQLPEDVHNDAQLGHFGVLRGLNVFEQVSALVVVSRTAIGPAQAEETAAVLSGRSVSALHAEAKWYPAAQGIIRWRYDPSAGWITKHVEHPDPTVEAVRAAITEDSLEQALGRGRNVRRSRSRPLVEYVLTTTPTNRPVDGTFSMAEFKAATGWVGAFLELGVWFVGGTKGLGGVLNAFARAMAAQRPDSHIIDLIGNPAFEGPDAAADWRKKQADDNPEVGALTRDIDKALGARAEGVEILCADYPLHDFAPVEAKVRGSRYFARLYVRTGEGQTAVEALTSLLGPVADELEIRSPSWK